ncbi:MAG TPA: NAD(P)-dependent oxidoreductase [Candidatus Saccharimonadales bacterium]|nr:NAD(P)-dependent oxidoreductase [Candidatus Saccharimonadales bacterium]
MKDEEIFIVGANGQLGTALRAKYPNAQSADIDEMDITDRDSVLSYDWSKVKVIINAAAYTNVDVAETPEGRIAAWKVNAQAVAYLVEAARKNDTTLVHISTDYVFDGTKDNHKEDEPFSPLSVYGASKAAGDVTLSTYEKYYLLRTSWVIGEGKNFVRTMLDLGQKDVNPTVVADQIGRPTFTSELVRAIDHLLSSKLEFGTYNLSNSGEPVSWAELTREIFKQAGFDLKVTDTTTAEYFAGKEGIAPRPLKSTLDLTKIQSAGFEPTDWKVGLTEYIKKEINK